MVKESMQWNEKVKSQPEPCICLEVKSKVLETKKCYPYIHNYSD